jgi:hypothetical protein
MISIAGTALPDPAHIQEDYAFRGAATEMADGSLQFDLVQSGAKRVWALTWTTLTAAQKTDLESALAAIKETPGVYTDMESNSHTVTRHGNERIRVQHRPTAHGVRYAVTVRLRER